MPLRRHPVAVGPQHGALRSVPIDRALIDRLKASYALVQAQDLRLAQLFYERLFAAAPGVRHMFREDPGVQARKLTDALDVIVRNLEFPAQNASLLSDLGRRHARYGATPEHYALVVELLTSCMQEVLADRATPGVINEWRLALHLVAAQMIAAAQSETTQGASNRAPGPLGPSHG